MSLVKAFKAYLYSEKLSSDFDKLLSPPYDVIHPETHLALLKSHPQNSIRLSLAENPDDSDRYKKMKATFEGWKKAGVLVQQNKPAFYLIRDEFELGGKKQTRIGFVGLLKLQKFGAGRVYPHEFTLAGPKKDRLALLEEMKAEVSQIFFCYRDPKLAVERLAKEYENREKRFFATDSSGVTRSLWVIDDEDDIREIEHALADCDFLIADGHHRYETALEYQRLHPGEESEYVQAYFTNSLSPGFSILPIHRVFSLPNGWSLDQLKSRLMQAGLSVETVETPSALGKLTARSSENEICFAVVFDGGKRALRIRRNKIKKTDSEIECLQKELFEGLFHWTPDELKKGLVQYEHTDEKFLEALRSDSTKLGIYLPACSYDQIMEVVKQGERMPQKSTFFAPKLASGLVNYQLSCD